MNKQVVEADRTRARPLRPWHRRFLAALRKAPNVQTACKAARISRQTAYQHKGDNPVFAAAWNDALDASLDELEATAFRKAKEGDAQLITWLLRCHRPEVYRETQRMELDARHVGVILLPEKESKTP